VTLDLPTPKTQRDTQAIEGLIRVLAETEAALVAALPDQVDAVINPATATPILLHRAQAALQMSEARYRHLLSRMAAIVFELDPDGTTLYVNDVVQQATGYTAHELLGKNWWDTFSPGDQYCQVTALQAQLMQGDVSNVELRLTTKSGSAIMLELNTANRYAPDGTLQRFLGLGIDITERRRAEAERETLAAIVQFSDDAIVGKTVEGIITSWNAGAERLYGYTVPEALGKPVAMLMPDNRSDDFPLIMSKIRNGEVIQHYETVRQKKDGTRFDVSLMVSPIRDSQGRIIGASAIARDITERKRAEVAVIQALDGERAAHSKAVEVQQRLAFLLEASTLLTESFDYLTRLRQFAQSVVPQIEDWCAVHVVEKDGSVTLVAVAHADPAKLAWANELQQRYPPDPNASRGVYQVLRSGQAEFYPDITDAMLIAGARDAEQLQLARQLGVTSVMIIPFVLKERVLGAISLVSAESGRHFGPDDFELGKDLARRAAMLIENARLYEETQRLNADLEQRVVQRTAQLEAANKELEAFSYSVSHDLRAPLRAIDGFSRMLLRDHLANLPPEAQRLLLVVRDNAQKMAQLIDDLLSFSRLGRQPLRVQTVSIADLVRQILDELKSDLEDRQVEVTVADVPACQADRALLKQVLVNLLTNALKYTRRRDIATIEVGSLATDGVCTYFVKDNGAGFDMAYYDKLFGVFQRLHSADDFEGTGVGLAIAQRIIVRHGGRIWAEGAVGQGATFYFTLDGPGTKLMGDHD